MSSLLEQSIQTAVDQFLVDRDRYHIMCLIEKLYNEVGPATAGYAVAVVIDKLAQQIPQGI